MNFENETILTQNRISIRNLLPEIGLADTRDEILNGLFSKQKSISSKFFYNDKGSQLFEEITRLDEYYPTRTEKKILERIAPELMSHYSSHDIIELGSGDASKISILLKAFPENENGSICYLPLDVSKSAIQKSADSLITKFPLIHVEGYVVDFISQFDLVQRDSPTLICFFGSTIGNFDKEASMKLLKNISQNMKKGDVLLLGMDMVKPESVLHAAYNDSKGITEAFNKNILNSINEIIDSDFKEDDFNHLAFFNKELSRIEMHLVAKKGISVCSPYFVNELKIARGENIHTENSHKYSPSNILEIAHTTGLKVKKAHNDPERWFTLIELEK